MSLHYIGVFKKLQHTTMAQVLTFISYHMCLHEHIPSQHKLKGQNINLIYVQGHQLSQLKVQSPLKLESILYLASSIMCVGNNDHIDKKILNSIQ